MSNAPPPFQSSRGREQLKLLEISHYVMIALALGGMAFLFVHYTIMNAAFSNPHMWDNAPQKPPFDPAQFIHAFVWFYLFMGAWGLVSLVANLASALCLRNRKSRTFSLFVAGLNCINVPFGTALGICTILVLTRPSVLPIYQD